MKIITNLKLIYKLKELEAWNPPFDNLGWWISHISGWKGCDSCNAFLNFPNAEEHYRNKCLLSLKEGTRSREYLLNLLDEEQREDYLFRRGFVFQNKNDQKILLMEVETGAIWVKGETWMDGIDNYCGVIEHSKCNSTNILSQFISLREYPLDEVHVTGWYGEKSEIPEELLRKLK